MLLIDTVASYVFLGFSLAQSASHSISLQEWLENKTKLCLIHMLSLIQLIYLSHGKKQIKGH